MATQLTWALGFFSSGNAFTAADVAMIPNKVIRSLRNPRPAICAGIGATMLFENLVKSEKIRVTIVRQEKGV